MTVYPITLQTLYNLLLAEISRSKNIRRVTMFNRARCADDNIGKDHSPRHVPCVATVVGYREDPSLYRRCLESYKGLDEIEMLVAGIDGNLHEDQQMMDIFLDVSKIARQQRKRD